jgi:hypothetical protein
MTDQKEQTSRRSFFRTIGLGAASAGALAVTGTTETKAAEGVRPDGSQGYRETEHVKRVYQLQRF